jgi:hypothetical protein
MAPEQMTGAPIDARVDVYAFGVLAFGLTTGRRPPLAATFTVSSGGPVAMSPSAEVTPYLEDRPAALAALIADCLAPLEGRPRDAGEVLRRLDAAAPRRGPSSLSTHLPRSGFHKDCLRSAETIFDLGEGWIHRFRPLVWVTATYRRVVSVSPRGP